MENQDALEAHIMDGEPEYDLNQDWDVYLVSFYGPDNAMPALPGQKTVGKDHVKIMVPKGSVVTIGPVFVGARGSAPLAFQVYADKAKKECIACYMNVIGFEKSGVIRKEGHLKRSGT